MTTEHIVLEECSKEKLISIIKELEKEIGLMHDVMS